MTLANLCPNLESLSLHLCGQINTDTLISWGQSFNKLRHLELVAPFLIRKHGWISFFENRPLESLLITQSPRIDLETLESLVKNCPNLTTLRLRQIGQMSDVLLQPLSTLGKLTFLDLSSPGSALSDQAVTDLLQVVGPKLVHLDLSSTQLSDDILPAIAKYCASLQSLALRHLDALTDKAVAKMFASMNKLQHVDMEKCDQLQAKALRSLLKNSGATLETLKIPGWKDVEAEALDEISRCKSLKEVNIGWCRQVTDYTVKGILDGCEHIEHIRVWGKGRVWSATDDRLQPVDRCCSA
jgi:DNA repair protein RAD7